MSAGAVPIELSEEVDGWLEFDTEDFRREELEELADRLVLEYPGERGNVAKIRQAIRNGDFYQSSVPSSPVSRGSGSGEIQGQLEGVDMKVEADAEMAKRAGSGELEVGLQAELVGARARTAAKSAKRNEFYELAARFTRFAEVDCAELATAAAPTSEQHKTLWSTYYKLGAELVGAFARADARTAKGNGFDELAARFTRFAEVDCAELATAAAPTSEQHKTLEFTRYKLVAELAGATAHTHAGIAKRQGHHELDSKFTKLADCYTNLAAAATPTCKQLETMQITYNKLFAELQGKRWFAGCCLL